METRFSIRNDPDKPENLNDIENRNINFFDTNNTDIVVNLVNIADIISSSKSNIFSSNIVLIALEPFILNDLTIKGIKQHVKITKDQLGNVFINDKEVKLVEISQGIKVLMVIRDESNIIDVDNE